MDGSIIELKSIPFEEVIGNPLSAIVEGESKAARATADFIREVGFEPPDLENFTDDFGNMRMVFFKMKRKDAEGKDVDVTIEVPLLSLVPIPAIQVREAVIEFAFRVNEIEKITGQQVESGKGLSRLPAKKFSLFGSLSRKRKKDPAKKDTETETTTDMQVRITLGQADFPIGVMRLFDLLEQGIGEKEVS